MPQQLAVSVENNFTKGLITESTGLNFPENAATDCDNVEFTYIGEVLRRLGIDYEDNAVVRTLIPINKAINSYKWNNVGGDGSTQFIVVQVGTFLVFFNATSATISSSLSNNVVGTVDMSEFTAPGNTYDSTKECQFTAGNGYLFAFHPSCSPVYVTYAAAALSGNAIDVQIRDFTGIPEVGIADNFRPNSLSSSHKYNLYNQGWTEQPGWTATSTTTVGFTGSTPVVESWFIQTGLTISVTDYVTMSSPHDAPFEALPPILVSGNVTAYNSGTGLLTVNVTGLSNTFGGKPGSNWTIVHPGTSYIDTYNTATSLYPSNAEQWFRYKNTSDVYSPSTTVNNQTLSVAAAPKGHFLLSAFAQDRSGISGVPGLTTISTTQRPTNGTWFQGRIFYTGINDSFAASGTAPFTTWSENIYFSQIVFKTDDFGKCYQANDPTAEDLFDLLPTDGGVIVIPGSGAIYKLFPIQNGMLIFAANGIWFLTGSQGIGFTANDYTITKLSNIESISSTSFIDVLGLPVFWNEEGIFQVAPQQGGGLAVNAITHGTIQQFYDDIPKISKKYARGAYDPVEYVVQWVYRSQDETDISDRYKFDKILNYKTDTQSFFPYTVDNTDTSINGIVFVQGPGGSTALPPMLKYVASSGTGVTFADIHDEDYVDWVSSSVKDYTSYLVSGYKLRGQAIRKFQPQYLQIWSKPIDDKVYYQVSGIWDYASNSDSGKMTSLQNVQIFNANHNFVHRRHKIRGRGYALQFKIESQSGQPFSIAGWAVVDTVNQGT